MTIGGSTVPSAAASMPQKPATRQPTSTAALTAIAPGADCASAVKSSISRSSSQWSCSTKRRRMNVTITKPPPNVHALM